MHSPKSIKREVYVYFSAEEIDRLTALFKFSVVLKLLHQRPSLDAIRSFIRCCWGIGFQPIVSSMHMPRHIFTRLTNEEIFSKLCPWRCAISMGSLIGPSIGIQIFMKTKSHLLSLCELLFQGFRLTIIMKLF